MRPSAARARPAGLTEGAFDTALGRLDVLETIFAPDDAELRSDALGLRSRVCWLTGRWDEAFSSANAAVAALEACPSHGNWRAHWLGTRRWRC